MFNVWQDEQHLRGQWRKTSVEEFQKKSPEWELLIDLDELSATEGEPWVFKWFEKLEGSDLAMVVLPRHGQDAVVIREFDLAQKHFVVTGFYVPESKSNLLGSMLSNF